MFFIFLFISIILLALSIILKIFKIGEYFGITRSRQDYLIVLYVIFFCYFDNHNNAKIGFQTTV